MALGFGVLGLTPAVFWAMTPRELAAAVKGRLGPEAMDEPFGRAELTGLMAAFPDKAGR